MASWTGIEIAAAEVRKRVKEKGGQQKGEKGKGPLKNIILVINKRK